MKTILRVAGTELRTMFYSPIAWFVLIVFLIQSGIIYFGSIESVAIQQEMGGIRLRYVMNLMARIFVGRSALFKHIMDNLYLYIPLLTMGLISRETSSGTIKLLYSSPIKVRDIIFGKYLAMIVYSLLMVSIVSIFVVMGISHLQAADKGMLMTSLVGFFLLLCTYSAIGLFMSCLTTYQIVAAVCTFVMIGVLSYIGSVWQGVEFIRDITYYLSIAGRTEKMLTGLLTSKDIVYFLVIIFIFLGLSVYRLKSGTESKPAFVKVVRYVGVVAVGIMIGIISSMPSLIAYYDATITGRHTVLPNVQKIIANLGEEPLEVVTYNNILGGAARIGADESYNQVSSSWEIYNRFKKGHNIIVRKTINYYDSTLDNNYMMSGYGDKPLSEIAKQVAKAGGISMSNVKSPEEMRKIIDLRPEFNRFVMQLKYKGKTAFLRIFDDQQMWPSETEVSAAFQRLMQAKMPKVGFLTGNLERSIFKTSEREYQRIASAKTFRYSLINQGFDVDTVSLETGGVPADISTLVIADPKLEFTANAQNELNKFIDKGGNLLIACEPSKNSPLLPVLAHLGIQLLPGQLIQEDKNSSPERVTLNFTPAAGTLSKYINDFRNDTLAEKVVMPGAVGLVVTPRDGFKVEPLLLSDETRSWNRVKDIDPDFMTSAISDNQGATISVSTDMGAINVSNPAKRNDGTVRFSPQDGDIKGPIITAVKMNRNIAGKDQRIIVTGDADFMRNSSGSTAAFLFTNSLFSFLAYNEYPIDSYRPASKDTALNLTTNQVDYLRIIFLWVLPAVLVVSASVLLLRRKRK